MVKEIYNFDMKTQVKNLGIFRLKKIKYNQDKYKQIFKVRQQQTFFRVKPASMYRGEKKVYL